MRGIRKIIVIEPLKFAELKAGRRLPSPSRTALALIETLKRENVTLPEICRLVQADPALTGRLLKLANSASYARPRPTVAITPEVLMALGLPAVRNLVLVFSLIDGQRSGASSRFNHAGFWSRTLAEACVAQIIGAHMRVAPPAEAFTLGLLAEIGRLGLAALEPAIYDEIIDAMGQDCDAARLAEAEHTRFGFNHAELGAALAADWGLPKLFVDALRWHTCPQSDWPFEADTRPFNLTAALALAHALADTFLLDDSARRDTVLALQQQAARLGIHDWLSMTDAALAAWREWGGFLGVNTLPLTPFSQLAALPEKGREKLRVLIVEDDTTTRRLIVGVLANSGFEVRDANNGEEGLKLAHTWLPDIMVTDILMPGMNGLELIRDLRNWEEGRHIYILVITVLDAIDNLIEAFALGADDYVSKPINARILRARLQAGVRTVHLRQELIERNIALSEALHRAEAMALTDALTGLPNRRHAIDRLTQECAAAERSDTSFCVLMMDIDHFKAVNDRFGHDAGDAVLVEVSRRLCDTARTSDVVCRFGGEEFMIIAINTDQAAAALLAERLRRSISQTPIRLPQGNEVTLTLSIGVAEKRTISCQAVDTLIKAADDALYAAKRGGRNRVVLAPAS